MGESLPQNLLLMILLQMSQFSAKYSK